MDNVTTATSISTRPSQQKRRKGKGKKKVNNSASSNQEKKVVTTQVTPLLMEETPESKIRTRMAEKIVNLSLEHLMTIFGSYVREYMCRRPFDLELSDIDIFSDTHQVEYFMKIVKSNGFRISTQKANKGKYHGDDRAFDVYHCTLGMVNDEFFLGKKIEIKVDYVVGPLGSRPPFRALDFECNAWIWDKYGIHLSQATGTNMDKMSPRDIKDHEIKILTDAKAKITTYFPMDKSGELRSMEGLNKYRRKIRAERIVKMLKRGWTITNMSEIVESQADPEDICSICQDAIEGSCIKMPCCVSKYHHDCFVTYAKSELDERTHVRCLQRCSELHV